MTWRVAATGLTGSRFVRFALVGTAGFAVNEGALWIALHLLQLNAYWGGAFSFLVAVTFTWWGNRTLTFAERAARSGGFIAKEWIAFVTANGVGFVVNYSVYATLVAVGAKPLDNPFLALVFGTVAGLVFNFVLSSRFVFRAPKLS